MAVDYNDKGYDYKSYWASRSYEHNAEVIALKKLLPRSGKSIIDIGGGFGRLLPVYEKRFINAVILDQSERLLEQAKSGSVPYGDGPSSGLQVKYIRSDIYSVPKSLFGGYDCAIMIRVAHHMNDLDKIFFSVCKLLEPGGLFIFEFANKMHFLNILKNTAKLNFKFFSKDPYRAGTFTLWHPKMVEDVLKKNGFEMQEKLSVSNFRSPLIKKIVPEAVLLMLESTLQKPLSYFNFGPSIFLKARRN